MIGSPIDQPVSAPSRSHFTDRPVVTYDPRGTARNPAGTDEIPPEQHAEDLHRVIDALGAARWTASAAAAVPSTLALAAAHPEDVYRAVAHEAPTAAYLPDKEVALAILRDMKATYRTQGNGPAMAKFIALVMYDGVLTTDYLQQPAPDPAMFGMSAEDDGDRTNPLMRNMPSCNEYEVDVDALKALGDRLVHAHGAESGQQLACRGAKSVAALLGVESVEFPSNHGGFLGGEYEASRATPTRSRPRCTRRSTERSAPGDAALTRASNSRWSRPTSGCHCTARQNRSPRPPSPPACRRRPRRPRV